MTRKSPRTPATPTPLSNGNMPDPAWVRYHHPQTTARPAPLHAQSPDVVHQVAPAAPHARGAPPASDEGWSGSDRSCHLPPTSHHRHGLLPSCDEHHRIAGGGHGGHPHTGDVPPPSHAHIMSLDAVMLGPPNCSQPSGVHATGTPPTPAVATDAHMTVVEAPCIATPPQTQPSATQQPELEPGTCAGTPPQQTLLDAPASVDAVDKHIAAILATAATINAATIAGPSAGFAAPDPMEASTSATAGTRAVHYPPERWSFPITDAYALPPDVAALELEYLPRGDAHMHEADADLLDTSAPDDPAMWTALPYEHVSVPRVVLKDVHGVWADAVVDALEYIQDAFERAHEETIAAGVQYVL